MVETMRAIDTLGDKVLQKEEINLLLKLKNDKKLLKQITDELGKDEFLTRLKADIRDINSIKDPSLKSRIKQIYKDILKKLGDPDWDKEIVPYSKTAQSPAVNTPEIRNPKDALPPTGVGAKLSEATGTLGEDANVSATGQSQQKLFDGEITMEPIVLDAQEQDNVIEGVDRFFPKKDAMLLISEVSQIYTTYIQKLVAKAKEKLALSSSLQNKLEDKFQKIAQASAQISQMSLSLSNPDAKTVSNSMDKIFDVDIFDDIDPSNPMTHNIEMSLMEMKEVMNYMLSSPKPIDTKDFRVRLLRQLRYIDQNDGTGTYDMSDDISLSLVDNVLNSERLNDPRLKTLAPQLQQIRELTSDSTRAGEFAKGLVDTYADRIPNWNKDGETYYTNNIEDFYKREGINIPELKENTDNYFKEVLHLDDVYAEFTKMIQQKEKQQGKTFTDEEKKQMYQTHYNNLTALIKQNLGKIMLNATLSQNQSFTEFDRGTNNEIDMYTQIEGIGRMSDRREDHIKAQIKELGTQIVLLYSGARLGALAVEGLAGTTLFNIINRSRLADFAVGGAIDGAVFHTSYTMLNNIHQNSEILDGLTDKKDWAKDVAIVGLLRGLNILKATEKGMEIMGSLERFITKQGNNLAFTDKVWNKIKLEGLEISMDAVAGYTGSAGINIYFGDKIDNSPKEIVKLVATVIGLRYAHKGTMGTRILVNKDANNNVVIIPQSKERPNPDAYKHINPMEEPATNVMRTSTLKEFPKTEVKENKQPVEGNSTTPGIVGEAGKAFGLIPLSLLFKEGQRFEEYNNIRDRLIQQGLTKKGADQLKSDKSFETKRNELIEKVLKLPEIQEYIKDKKWTVDMVRDSLMQDFDDMIDKLGGVEQLQSKMEGTQEQKQEKAIRETLRSMNDLELVEIVVSMYRDYTKDRKKKTQNPI